MVAVWAPAERIISGVQRLTNQLNGVLFPTIVDSDASRRPERLQQILLRGHPAVAGDGGADRGRR